MRPIKFRGQRLDTREWVFGNLCVSPDRDYYISDFEYGIAVEVIPETVGQFTGLLDKKGKQIYEGDVITSDEIHTRAIKWNGYECKFNAVEWGIDKAIILGNIHDNPAELLTQL